MSLIELTLQDTPARPIVVNTDQVATLKPLRAILPSANSNTPGATETKERGTEIVMANGSKHNVLEPYAEVLERVKDKPVPQAPVTGLSEALSQKASQPNLSDLKAGVPVSDTKLAINIGEPEHKTIDAVAEPWIPESTETEQIRQDIAQAAATDFQAELDKGVQAAQETAEAIKAMDEEPKKAPAKKAAAKKATPKEPEANA